MTNLGFYLSFPSVFTRQNQLQLAAVDCDGAAAAAAPRSIIILRCSTIAVSAAAEAAVLLEHAARGDAQAGRSQDGEPVRGEHQVAHLPPDCPRAADGKDEDPLGVVPQSEYVVEFIGKTFN